MKPVVRQKSEPKQITPEELTRGQYLADKLASQVGSWKFLICQSTILAGWVGMNLAPGIPHWDESPFIMLNLVFSFASAYTAPIVLMSQNRQSDTDRRNAEIDHQVNLRAGQNIELLHEKLDTLHSQQIAELTQIVKEQQQMLREMKVNLAATDKEIKDNQIALAPGLIVQINNKFPKVAPVNQASKHDKSIVDNAKVIDQYIRR
ncbi:DUF1003 domain-containing protein [Nostoc sp. PCC 7107]|uniref:DUF1003 domain-containing protein n=1 Tax=Nostoc sp. PCC 7107 TaxID=317936 RepID=UPI00029EE441|nr:DUF1003 domain-containing protein [Nostoc sp. PCC 7107]AFY41727.1 protein of unknown function DUF1003 [Nostoc sp. PCC 7107]